MNDEQKAKDTERRLRLDPGDYLLLRVLEELVMSPRTEAELCRKGIPPEVPADLMPPRWREEPRLGWYLALVGRKLVAIATRRYRQRSIRWRITAAGRRRLKELEEGGR